MPDGTDFHWGVNYKVQNETETQAQIRLLAAAFQGGSKLKVNLRELEVGNEVDLADRGSTAPPSTPQSYVSYWNRQIKAAMSSGAITLGSASGTYLSPGAFARSIRFNTNWIFTAMSVFSAGLLNDGAVAAVTKQYTGHLYSASYNAAFAVQPGVLMDKVNVRGNLSTRVADAVVARKEGLVYVLVSSFSTSREDIS